MDLFYTTMIITGIVSAIPSYIKKSREAQLKRLAKKALSDKVTTQKASSDNPGMPFVNREDEGPLDIDMD